MSHLSVVELHKDEFSFSAGHFTIFSETEREDLHGHNYNVSASLQTQLQTNGLSFDYRFYKEKILSLCRILDRKFLLPQHSQFLRLEEKEDMLFAHFNQEKIPFLKRDVVVLPVSNVTIEELSHWFLQQLITDLSILQQHHILGMTVKVYNGPGQSGAASWSCD